MQESLIEFQHIHIHTHRNAVTFEIKILIYNIVLHMVYSRQNEHFHQFLSRQIAFRSENNAKYVGFSPNSSTYTHNAITDTSEIAILAYIGYRARYIYDIFTLRRVFASSFDIFRTRNSLLNCNNREKSPEIRLRLRKRRDTTVISIFRESQYRLAIVSIVSKQLTNGSRARDTIDFPSARCLFHRKKGTLTYRKSCLYFSIFALIRNKLGLRYE